MIEENNVIEQAPPQSYFSWGAAAGGVPSIPPVLFPEVLLRRNVVRATDGLADPPSVWARIGLALQAAGGAIIEENVIEQSLIDVTNTNPPLQFWACSSAQFFANQTPAGALIQGFNTDPAVNANVNELSTNVEDAALLAF